MANKKSLKDAATAGTSVFDTIIKGAQNVQDAQDVQDVQDAPRVFKEKVQLERLNLKIPAEIKEYLTVAAAKASIKNKRNISLTEYLCELVRADMEKRTDN